MARRRFSVAVTAALMAATAAAGPTTAPTTQPLAAAATQPSAPAAALLAEVDAAYGKLASAEFDGHITAHLDVAGRVEDHDAAFTSAYAGPTRFRHDVPGDITACSTGSHVFACLTTPSEYVTGEAPKGRVAAPDWPVGVGRLLADQNPSLLLALVPSAGAELVRDTGVPVRVAPTRIDNVDCPSLRIDVPGGVASQTLAFDPGTHLLRRQTTDLRGLLLKRGATDVRAATVTVDYTTAKPGVTIDAARFAYAPPAGAVVATAGPVAEGDTGGDGEDPAAAVSAALVGKAAPPFTLNGLDGKPVSVADLRGKVVVLDMWATWCGPCVMSLPDLDAMAKAYRDASAAVAVYAVNQTAQEQQGPEAVRAFVAQKGWTLPVLLDVDGRVGEAYKAEAIPETVIVGKDGIVKKVVVGGGQDAAIKAAVDRELGH